jgi:hypothetical protein
MPITLQNTTITGLAAGGLPNGVITAANLASGVGGKILQVKFTELTSNFFTTSSSFQAVPNFNISITPVSSTSKIMFEVNHITQLIQGWSAVNTRLWDVTAGAKVGYENQTHRFDWQSDRNQGMYGYSSHNELFWIDSWGTTARTFRVEIRNANGTGQSGGINNCYGSQSHYIIASEYST